jgi:hypothetical protein
LALAAPSFAAASTSPSPAPAPGFFIERDVPTGIASDADTFVSFRYMRHVWLTSDGTLATLVQQGGLGGLRLHKSLDLGLVWTLESVVSSHADLISDGLLASDDGLLLVTSVSGTGPIGDVLFQRMSYDSIARTWTLDPSTPTVVFDSTQALRASRATIAADSNGVLWCAFRLQSTATGNFSLPLYCSLDGGLTWQDTLNAFGSSNTFEDKNAKVLATGSGIAVLFQDVQGSVSAPVRLKAWAYRDDSQPLEDPLLPQTVAVMANQGGDPLGTHWSVAGDDAGNVHLTYQDGRIKYLRFDGFSKAWASPLVLGPLKGSYNSITVDDSGDLFVFAHLGGLSGVYVRRYLAGMQQWTNWIPVSSSAHAGSLRMCSPERVDDLLPMLYQVNASAPYDLLYCLFGV